MKDTLKKILIEMLSHSYPMIKNVIVIENEYNKNTFICFLNIGYGDWLKIGEENIINYVSDIATYMGVKLETVSFY